MKDVLLADLADHLGVAPGHALALLDHAGGKVEEDALGRLVVDGDSARTLLQERKAAREQELRDQADYQSYLKARAARRHAHLQEVHRVALAEAMRAQLDTALAINAQSRGILCGPRRSGCDLRGRLRACDWRYGGAGPERQRRAVGDQPRGCSR